MGLKVDLSGRILKVFLNLVVCVQHEDTSVGFVDRVMIMMTLPVSQSGIIVFSTLQ